MAVGNKARWSAVGAVLLAMLSACGGGGGGGGGGNPTPSFAVSFQTAELDATVFQGQAVGTTSFVSPDVTVSANVQANIPAGYSGTPYVRLVDSGKGFGKSAFTVESHSDGSYSAMLTPDVTLAPGTYTGNLSLQFCPDLSCTTPFPATGATLPYTLTVGAALAAQIYINGTLAATVAAGNAPPLQLDAPNGASIEITSNIPVQWQYSAGPNLVHVTVGSDSTSTDFRATLSLDSLPYSNEIQLSAYTPGIAQESPAVNVTLQ